MFFFINRFLIILSTICYTTREEKMPKFCDSDSHKNSANGIVALELYAELKQFPTSFLIFVRYCIGRILYERGMNGEAPEFNHTSTDGQDAQ